MEKLKVRNEELRTLKGKIHEEYTKLKNVNAINMEKILDFRLDFHQIWKSQIQHKVKHSVEIYDDTDITEIQGKIQENNSKLKTLVKIHDEKNDDVDIQDMIQETKHNLKTLVEIHDEKVERLKHQMDYINRELRIQMDKTKEEKQLWVKLRRELKQYPNVEDVKDPDDEVFMQAWFIANKIIPNTTPSANEDNFDDNDDDDKITEPFHSDHDDDDNDDENSQYSTEKPLQNDEEKFIMNMYKSINSLRHELTYEECAYEVVKNINEDCKREVIEFRNKLPKFF